MKLLWPENKCQVKILSEEIAPKSIINDKAMLSRPSALAPPAITPSRMDLLASVHTQASYFNQASTILCMSTASHLEQGEHPIEEDSPLVQSILYQHYEIFIIHFCSVFLFLVALQFIS